MQYFKRAWALFTALFVSLSVMVGPKAKSTDSAQLISENLFVLNKLVLAGQGVSNDGEYYYTSNTVIKQLNMTSLAKFTFDGEMKLVEKNLKPLPNEVIEKGFDHIGGISVYNGKLYASVESEKSIKACILVFNTSDLSWTGEVYYLPNELFTAGIPWLAVDGQTGLLYASRWAETTSVHVYDVENNMEYVKTLTLSSPIKRIQGGEFHDGCLYLSSDTLADGTESCKRILKINIDTGEVSDFALRDLGIDSTEAEGMTIGTAPDGSNLHVLDWNKKTMTVYMRHYKVNF